MFEIIWHREALHGELLSQAFEEVSLGWFRVSRSSQSLSSDESIRQVFEGWISDDDELPAAILFGLRARTQQNART